MFPSLLPSSMKQIIRSPATLKKALPRPVHPCLNPWRTDPCRHHTRTYALAQFLQMDYDAHIAHLYHTVLVKRNPMIHFALKTLRNGTCLFK